jgi:hypothetical protein
LGPGQPYILAYETSFSSLTLFLNLCNLLNNEEYFFVDVVVDGKGFLELAESDIEPINGNNMPSARRAVTAIMH